MCFRRQTGAGASELPQNLMWLDATLNFNIQRFDIRKLNIRKDFFLSPRFR